MTLETAKALKSAGWDKETEKQWRVVDNSKGQYLVFPPPHIHNSADFLGTDTLTYPCPSLEELLAVMPDVQLNKRGNEFDVYFFGKSPMEVRNEIAHNPTEAVAQLWLKLRKEGIV